MSKKRMILLGGIGILIGAIVFIITIYFIKQNSINSSYLPNRNIQIQNNQNQDPNKDIDNVPSKIHVDKETKNKVIQPTNKISTTAQWVYPSQNISMGDMGIISVATPLKVIKAANGQYTVEMDGYQMQGTEQVIYIAKGQRIILAILQEPGIKALKLGKAEQDKYGNQWRKATLITTIKDNFVVGSQKSLWAYAEQLDNTYCSTCHAKIPAHHFTANAWPSVVKSMSERTFITKKELEMLTKYFQYNAKDFSKH